jgi:hypothetical protein
MIGHLDLQRRLEDLLRQPGQQPGRPGQLNALGAGRGDQPLGQQGHSRVRGQRQIRARCRIVLGVRHA